MSEVTDETIGRLWRDVVESKQVEWAAEAGALPGSGRLMAWDRLSDQTRKDYADMGRRFIAGMMNEMKKECPPYASVTVLGFSLVAWMRSQEDQ